MVKKYGEILGAYVSGILPEFLASGGCMAVAKNYLEVAGDTVFIFVDGARRISPWQARERAG